MMKIEYEIVSIDRANNLKMLHNEYRQKGVDCDMVVRQQSGTNIAIIVTS